MRSVKEMVPQMVSVQVPYYLFDWILVASDKFELNVFDATVLDFHHGKQHLLGGNIFDRTRDKNTAAFVPNEAISYQIGEYSEGIHAQA